MKKSSFSEIERNAPNHTIQRMEASRLGQFQFSPFGRLASTADGER